MWQTPNFLLKLSIVCFIVGLVILIWDTARLDGVRWGNNDAKVNFEFDRGIGIIVLMQIDCYPVHRCDLHLFIVVCSIRSWPVL
jgi:hypothetical protein